MAEGGVKSIDPFKSGQAGLARQATYASVSVATMLIVIKIVAWSMTDSVAILASLLDSMIDAFASVLTLIAVRRATAPASRQYRYGHGKAEPLAALAQAAFISGSAVLLLIQAGERLVRPAPVTETEIGLIVMTVSIVATIALVTFQKWVLSKGNSVAIKADSLHYKGDLLANVAVILALVLNEYMGWIYADPVFGLLIALYILWNAREVATEALFMLMDRELPEEERQRIIDIARSYKEVIDVHDVRTRQSGPYKFIQMHIALNGQLSLNRAHAVAEAVELEIMEAFPASEVIVHEDPGTRDYDPAERG